MIPPSIECPAWTRRAIAVCCGVGVDSVAMLVEMERRGIRPDLITFADTGGEKPETYLYVPILQQWLRDVGFPQLQVCRYVPKRAPYDSLFGNCMANETLPSLAFGWKSCSLKWKRDAQEPLRRRLPLFVQEWADGERIAKLIGFDATESRRTFAAAGAKDQELYDMRYPLQDWAMTRDTCERTIADAGLPVPMKSACWFCPASKVHEINWLREHHPDLHSAALAMEHNYRTGKHWRGDDATVHGLGRRFAWSDRLPILDDDDFAALKQLELFAAEDDSEKNAKKS